MSHERLGLFDTPPNRPQVWACLVVAGLLLAALILILPVREAPWYEVVAFIPVVDAVMCIGDLITATLLFAQASVFRSRALTVLAAGYLYMALLFLPHALTFPGAFAPDGVLGGGPNTTAWLALFRRVAAPVAILFYVLLKRADAAADPGTERPAVNTHLGVLAATALAVGVTVLATAGHDLLPPYYLNRANVLYAYAVTYESAVLALLLITIVMLFRQRTSVLDLWLLVALCGWLMQSVLVMTLQSRFTAGWYWLYLVTLFSHVFLTLALIAESNRLYARVVLATAARKREREARLMSIDAMATAFSHEVGQPLAAVGANATAGLNWLTRPEPNVQKAMKSLQTTIDAGHRATDVIKSVRAMFAKGPGRASEFNLNDLVHATAALFDREMAAGRISLHLALDEALPPILADRIQMQQVLVNLFANAIESLIATEGRSRHLTVRSAPLGDHDVLLEVSDNGVGIAADVIESVFEPFFTTKPTAQAAR